MRGIITPLQGLALPPQPMIQTTAELAALLRGTWLEPAELTRRREETDLHATLGVDLPGSDPIEAWKLLRRLMPRTGRYPLVVWRPNFEARRQEPVDSVDRPPAIWFGLNPSDGSWGRVPPPPPPERVDPLAQLVDKVERVVPGPSPWRITSDAENLQGWLAIEPDLQCRPNCFHPLLATFHRFGAMPSLDTVRELAARGDLRGMRDLERWLMNWERSRAGSDEAWSADAPTGHLEWHDGMAREAALLLLPTAEPWQALAYDYWWGQFDTPERPLHYLRHWQRRHDAELVCNYGTLLQFIVGRPPLTPDDAFELALEQHDIASDTIVLPGISLRDHARALIGRREWLLHSKP